MLSKQKRLSGRDITQLFTGGTMTGTPFFVVRYSKTALGSGARFAVITPKNVANKAFLRNSARRKWYGSLKKTLSNNPKSTPKPGIYAFILKKSAFSLTPTEREQYLAGYFAKQR